MSKKTYYNADTNQQLTYKDLDDRWPHLPGETKRPMLKELRISDGEQTFVAAKDTIVYKEEEMFSPFGGYAFSYHFDAVSTVDGKKYNVQVDCKNGVSVKLSRRNGGSRHRPSTSTSTSTSTRNRRPVESRERRTPVYVRVSTGTKQTQTPNTATALYTSTKKKRGGKRKKRKTQKKRKSTKKRNNKKK